MAKRVAIRIGVSACLLGEEVRYDGGHKYDRFVTETLGKHVEFVPVCPEVEFGLGVPRETIELVQIGADVRLRFTENETDITEAMREFTAQRVAELSRENLSGYILKRGSPSCGMQDVKVRHPGGEIERAGIGLFAAAVLSRMPSLPVEEESSLRDPELRTAWFARVLEYHREVYDGNAEVHKKMLDDLTSSSMIT